MSTAEEHPRDLPISRRRGRWVLAINAPGLFSGTAESTSRALVEDIAKVWRDYAAVTT